MKIVLGCLLAGLLGFTSVAMAESVDCGAVFGPAGDCMLDNAGEGYNPDFNAPVKMCFREGCVSVHYEKWTPAKTSAVSASPAWFALAVAMMSNGYEVMGWAGPCMPGWDCPVIYQQAHADLYLNTLRLMRRDRWNQVPY